MSKNLHVITWELAVQRKTHYTELQSMIITVGHGGVQAAVALEKKLRVLPCAGNRKWPDTLGRVS